MVDRPSVDRVAEVHLDLHTVEAMVAENCSADCFLTPNVRSVAALADHFLVAEAVRAARRSAVALAAAFRLAAVRRVDRLAEADCFTAA